MPLRVRGRCSPTRATASRKPGPYADVHRQPLEYLCPLLMALGRVADYLQVEADRAPAAILSLSQSLYSPLSSARVQAHPSGRRADRARR